jgi:N-acetyl-beta-hexosaminidase
MKTTLLQLLEARSSGWARREAAIRDRPRFPWRGCTWT